MKSDDRFMRQILTKILYQAYTKPYGLFYRLDKCFSSYFFIHIALHPSKTYIVKNKYTFCSKIGELIFCLRFVSHTRASIGQKGKTFI